MSPSIRSFLASLMLAVAAASSLFAAEPPPVTPPSGHPRLLLRPDDLSTIRASRDDPALAASWAELRRRTYLPDDYTPEPRYDLAVLHAAEASAFLAMIENDHAGKRRAIELAFILLGTQGPDRKAGYFALRTMGRALFTVAEVYDWCHDAATPNERLRLCALMREHASVMEIKFPPTTPNALAGHSSEDQLLRDQLAMAIATFDEDPEIYELVAGRFYREFTSPRDFHYAGHFHHQGNSYGFGRFGSDMAAALLLTQMDAPEPWSLSAMSQVPYYFLYLRRPDGGLIKEGDDYLGDSRAGGSYWAPPAHLWMNFTALFRDPQFAAQWRRQLDKVETKFEWLHDPVDPIIMIVTRPDQVPSGELSQLPLTRYFPEPFGAMIARTGWNIGPDSRDAVAYLKIGTHRFDNHQHADSGQFQLFHRGSLAIDSGIYQSSTGAYGSPHFRNYFRRAVAHNTILIGEPTETFRFDGDPIIDDSGQRMLDGAWTMEDFWKQDSRTGQILARFAGHDPVKPEVSLIKGDLTPAYSDTKARRVTRTMAFFPLEDASAPAVLVVLDRVESVRADQRKVALLHSIEEPRIEKNVATVTRSGGQINILRWAPAAIERDSETASRATLSFDLRSLAQTKIVKAELSVRPPWSLTGDLEVYVGDKPIATVAMAKTAPVPMPDVTDWIREAQQTSPTRAELTVKRIGGDSRGVLGTVVGPHAPHLKIWIEEEPYAGKLVQTTLLPKIEDLDLRRIGGPGQEFISGGQNWPAAPRIPEPMASNEAGAWRIEIGTKSDTAAVRFLNVYQVMDTAEQPSPVRNIRGRGVIGASVSGRMLIASDEPAWIAAGSSFEVTPADVGRDGQAMVVLTDLAAGDHSLWQADALIAMAAVENHSHTWMTRLRAGSYELKSR